jgi:phosphatidylinositol-4,5-bisphosphate 3-kinase
MKNIKCKYRFGLILEAYCRATDTNLKVLLKQIDAIDKFSNLTQSIKNNPDNLWMINSRFLQNTLVLASFKNSISNFPSPTNISVSY